MEIDFKNINRRPRRLRRTPQIRALVRETNLHTNNFVYPLFVVSGKKYRREIGSMPNVFQLSIDEAVKECAELLDLGINSVILFGIPESKDEQALGAYDDNGIVQQAVRAIKRELPEMLVITDVCLCEYTNHGHCGILDHEDILNDPTVELLARTALSHAQSGADIVAPSDMMDGRIGAIREMLDDTGFEDIAIMSYSAKYASAFYGPFREAAESTPKFGDRLTHQMDVANSREAMTEIELDLNEGADILMIKPAMPNLDIIKSVYEVTNVPIAAYQVSGEYSMIFAAANNGWLDLQKAMVESLTVIRRAGASIIITYFAKDIARIINQT